MRLLLPVAGLFFASAALGAPTGMSPWLYGMHDPPPAGFFPTEATPSGSCTRGWITELRYIGADGVCGAGDIDLSSLADQGYGVIMRLDYGTPAQPPYESQWDGFAQAFADCVARSSGVRVWVVGNEPNLPWGHPEDRPFTPAEYGEIYRRVVAAVDALDDGAEHEILFAAQAPWAALSPWGDWDDGLGAALDHVTGAGGHIDGVAIHAYTRANFSAGAISSEEWFPGREGKWHLHFRGYRDTTQLLAARGLTNLPLYITEAGNACDPPCDPYPDQDVGYFVALYEEIHAWNQAHPAQVIRAVTPYRWTTNDDGSGRDFCIGCSDPLKADLLNAVALGRTWTDTGCHTPQDVVPPVDAGSPDAGPPDAGTVAATVQGVVWDLASASLPGDPGALPVDDATVWCSCAACACAAPTSVRAGDAFWALELPLGEWTVSASAPGYATASRSVLVAGPGTLWASLGLSAADDDGGAPPPPPDGGGSIPPAPVDGGGVNLPLDAGHDAGSSAPSLDAGPAPDGPSDAGGTSRQPPDASSADGSDETEPPTCACAQPVADQASALVGLGALAGLVGRALLAPHRRRRRGWSSAHRAR